MRVRAGATCTPAVFCSWGACALYKERGDGPAPPPGGVNVARVWGGQEGGADLLLLPRPAPAGRQSCVLVGKDTSETMRLCLEKWGEEQLVRRGDKSGD